MTMRESPRLRRLRSDLRALQQLQAESTILEFELRGSPPEWYLLRFHGQGLFRPEGQETVRVRHVHEVSVNLGASYPRMMPELAWKSPVFHPNISGSGVVCLGGYGTYWVPSVGLDELCTMLWDMIRYHNFDVNSPYNREAAAWAKTQRELRLPVDPRPLRDRVAYRSGSRADSAAPVIGTAGKRPSGVVPPPVVVPPPLALAPPVVAPPRVYEPEPEVIFLDAVEEAEPLAVAAGGEQDIVFID